jgi:hypothetical protein
LIRLRQCSELRALHKGKAVVRRRRKASGPKRTAQDSGVAGIEKNQDVVNPALSPMLA